jgi:hypothetical protein
MRCEEATVEVSAALDGERIDADTAAHLATCERCRTFQEQATEVRRRVRLSPAKPVPDLAPRVMAAVAVERRRRARRREWRRGWMAAAAGFIAAAVLLGGLPFVRRGPDPALATEVPRLVAAASTRVRTYRARLELEEHGWHRDVPRRRFRADVAFAAPERLHVTVRDLTDYPPGSWPRNDVRLAVDRDRWSLEAPVVCPRQSLPACAPPGRERTAISGREPFDGDAPLPTDVVLPVRALAGTERVRVLGQGTALGRDTVTVALPYRDAAPVLAAITAAGSWRPFHPGDEAVLALDRSSWFPLRIEVRAGDAADRLGWSARHGLPAEDPGRRLLAVTTTSFSTDPVGALPALAETGRDQGFRDLPFDQVAADGAVLPTDTAGLRPYRAGTFEGPGRPRDEVVATFARGLAWLKLRQTRSWRGPGAFGDLSDLAAEVALPGGATGYYEPATGTRGRRLGIHTPELDVALESNLPRRDLLRVAASLPIEGRPLPAAWRIRRWPGGAVRTVPIERALGPGALVPARLPAGYDTAVAQVARSGATRTVLVTYRRSDTEPDGEGIRLAQAPGEGLPPPMDPGMVAVTIRGTTGRYSADRAELEWIEAGSYRSIRAPGFDLADLVAMAEALEEEAP